MKVEYLIIVKQRDFFCISKKAFIGLLNIDSSIQVTGNVIRYKRSGSSQEFSTEFTLETGELPSKEERFFHLTLSSAEEGKEEEFTKLTETIREIVKRISPDSTRVNILWDDIGRQYAIQAYPLINEVENLMRKLISRFMLVNVGMDWSKKAIHRDIVSKIEQRNEDKDLYLDDLYKTDFIHLSDVLFKSYRALTYNELDKLLLSKDKILDTDIEEIKKILPISNWERYFSGIIQYDGDKLKVKWKLLYELRNDVAHNRSITRADFGKIKGLTIEIKKVINQAIEALDKINLGEEDKENIITSYQPMIQSVIEAARANAAEALIVQKAVSDWYMKNYPIRKLQDDYFGEPFDLVFLLDDDSRIAIQIKYFFGRGFPSAWQTLKPTLEFAQELFYMKETIDEFHMILVGRDNQGFPDWQNSHLARIVYELKPKLSSQIKVFVGNLDSENELMILGTL